MEVLLPQISHFWRKVFRQDAFPTVFYSPKFPTAMMLDTVLAAPFENFLIRREGMDFSC